jgi:hypothetical protein
MATLKTLDPAVTVSRPPFEWIATEAGRTSAGLAATVQVRNGEVEVIAARVVRLAQPEDRRAFANEIGPVTGLGPDEIDADLLELAAGIEGALRQQAGGASPAQPGRSQASSRRIWRAARPRNSATELGESVSRDRSRRMVAPWRISSVSSQRATPGKRRSITVAIFSSRRAAHLTSSSLAARSPA